MTRRKATVVIYDGDDLHQLQLLRRKVLDAVEEEAGLTATLADTAAEDARREHNEFRKAARERATEVVLEPLRWEDWDELEEQHPPRMVDKTETVQDTVKLDDLGSDEPEEVPTEQPREVTRKVVHPDDVGVDVNTKTLPRELLPRSIVKPDGFDWRDVSKPDMLRLFYAALTLNRRDADPKDISAFSDSEPDQDDDDSSK